MYSAIGDRGPSAHGYAGIRELTTRERPRRDADPCAPELTAGGLDCSRQTAVSVVCINQHPGLDGQCDAWGCRCITRQNVGRTSNGPRLTVRDRPRDVRSSGRRKCRPQARNGHQKDATNYAAQESVWPCVDDMPLESHATPQTTRWSCNCRTFGAYDERCYMSLFLLTSRTALYVIRTYGGGEWPPCKGRSCPAHRLLATTSAIRLRRPLPSG